MKYETLIENVGDGAAFVVKHTNTETGKVKDAETYHSEKPLQAKEVGAVLQQDYKQGKTRRLVWLTMLAEVLGMPRLDGFKGKGDVKTGKSSPEFRSAVRDCEGEYLRALIKAGHVKLHVGKDDNEETVFQQFATSVREDKNYSNVKSTVMKYYSFVGSHPKTPSGYLIPVPVMAEAVNAALAVGREPADNSYAAKIDAIMETLNKDENIPAEAALKAYKAATMLATTLKGIVDHYAEMATQQAQDAANIQAQAAKIIQKASTPASPAPSPSKAKKAEPATADAGKHEKPAAA